MIQQFDTAPGLTRTSYRFEPDRLARGMAAVRQVLGPDADRSAPDGLQRIVLLGEGVSVAATEGQHQQIQTILKDDEAEDAELGEEAVLKVYRVKNRDAAEIESTMLWLIGFPGCADAAAAARR